MHLRNSPITSRSSGRLAQFHPISVPRTKQLPSVWNRSSPRPGSTTRRSKSLDLRPKSAVQRKSSKVVHFASKPTGEINDPEEQEEERTLEEYLIARKPSAIYRFNSIQFLNSLRNFRQHSVTATAQQTTLSRHYKMSKDILDSFVRLKTAQIEGLFGEPRAKPLNGFAGDSVKHEAEQTAPVDVDAESASAKPSANSRSPPTSIVVGEAKESLPGSKKQVQSAPAVSMFRKKNPVRPKSASIHSRRSRLQSGASKSTSKLNKFGASDINSDDELPLNGHNRNDDDDDLESNLEPFYHRSLDKISSIANWERQIRYELEIEKELQRRELDRQKEKIQNDQRKLEEWDKHLRIELDARERKIRLSEEELRSRYEEFNQKSGELMRREQMINEIVTERIKAEMKFEIEKLRKKFNELELDKNNLTKKEERVKEVEARLHEQVKIVKEKIDSKRLTDIEMAKYKKELDIVRKENEVLKERVDSMEDYQVTKFENRSMKSELQILRETLDSKNQELERDRERWEKEQRANDQKVIALRGELRKTEQELVIQKQKAQGDLEEMTSKYDAVNGQLKRLQAFIKEHIAKLNSDFSSAAQSLNAHYKSTGQGVFLGTKSSHLRHHSSSLHLHRMGRGTGGLGSNRFNHQRSVSMDGGDYMTARAAKGWAPFHRSPARGCRLCNDEEECELEHDVIGEDEYLVAHSRQHNGALIDYGDIEEEAHEKGPSYGDNETFRYKQQARHQHEHFNGNSSEAVGKPVQEDDEVLRKIVEQVCEKMSHQVHSNANPNYIESVSPVETSLKNGQLGGDNLISRLMSSISEQETNTLPRHPNNGNNNSKVSPKAIANTNATPKSNGIALQELLVSTYSSVESSPVKATTTGVLPDARWTSVRGLKSLLSMENEDLDADTNEELPNYHESTRMHSPPGQQHRSLLEEIVASEGVAGTSSSFNMPNGQVSMLTRVSTDVGPRVNAAALHSSPSVENDDNNNHVLSKKPPEPIAPSSQSTSAVRERPLSRSNSDSRCDSKSESFEIDW